MNEKGESFYKGKTYSNIRKEATVAQIDQSAKALGGFSANLLNSVECNDSFDII